MVMEERLVTGMLVNSLLINVEMAINIAVALINSITMINGTAALGILITLVLFHTSRATTQQGLFLAVCLLA